MCEVKFYVCNHCGNLVAKIKDAGVPLVCCGQKMDEMVPNTVDASGEKHVPVAKVEGNDVVVEVGSVAHPMEEEHYIEWIYLQTTKGGQRKCLKPGEAPVAKFALVDEEPVAVFELCNIHGLWKSDIWSDHRLRNRESTEVRASVFLR